MDYNFLRSRPKIKSLMGAMLQPIFLSGSTSPKQVTTRLLSGPEVIKLFSHLTQLSMTCNMLINVKMPTTIVDILIFISMVDTSFEGLIARKVFNFQHFRFYDLL